MMGRRLSPELYSVSCYLGEIARADVIIDATRKELERLESQRTIIKGVSYDGVKVQTTDVTPPTEAAVLHLEDCRRRLLDIIAYSQKRREKILGQIAAVKNSRYMRLLWQYYVDGDRLVDIAGEMNYSYRQITRLHREALKQFGITNGML